MYVIFFLNVTFQQKYYWKAKFEMAMIKKY